MRRTRRKIIWRTALAAGIFLLAGRPAHANESRHEALVARVARVSGKMESVTGLKPPVTVVPGESLSAYVLPNRTIVLTSGLVEACATDDEVAFVLAHETSHIIARDYANAPAPPELTSAREMPLALIKEINADLNGVAFLRKAGFSPSAAIEILKRISVDSGNSFNKRIEALRSYIKSLKD